MLPEGITLHYESIVYKISSNFLKTEIRAPPPQLSEWVLNNWIILLRMAILYYIAYIFYIYFISILVCLVIVLAHMLVVFLSFCYIYAFLELILVLVLQFEYKFFM